MRSMSAGSIRLASSALTLTVAPLASHGIGVSYRSLRLGWWQGGKSCRSRQQESPTTSPCMRDRRSPPVRCAGAVRAGVTGPPMLTDTLYRGERDVSDRCHRPAGGSPVYSTSRGPLMWRVSASKRRLTCEAVESSMRPAKRRPCTRSRRCSMTASRRALSWSP